MRLAEFKWRTGGRSIKTECIGHIFKKETFDRSPESNAVVFHESERELGHRSTVGRKPIGICYCLFMKT